MSASQPPSSRYCCNTRQISCKVYQNIISLTITQAIIYFLVFTLSLLLLLKNLISSLFFSDNILKDQKLTKQTGIKLKWSSFFCVLKEQSSWMKKFVSCEINELNILFVLQCMVHTYTETPFRYQTHTVKNDSRFGGAICYLSFSLRHVKWYFMSV